MKVLECSSKGDKRFSAFYAKVEVNGKMASIEEHYQLSKRFKDEQGKYVIPQKVMDAKGKTPVHFVLGGKIYDVSYLSSYYSLLWVKYLDKNPELVQYAKDFDDFTDMFRGSSINCQADVVKKYVKQGREAILKENKEFLTLLNNRSYVNEIVGDLLCAREDIYMDTKPTALASWVEA